MNTENKLLKLRKLADAMYYAANYLTTDASRMHKAMEEYHQFIINEYHKEEPVSEEWVEELRAKLDSLSKEDFKKVFDKYAVDFNEEPVSEIDFEQELYKYFGQVKDFTLGMRIAKRFYEIGRNHQEPVSEDMWEASKQYALRQVLASTDAEMSEQDYLGLRLFSGFELAVAHKDGAQWQKQQMEVYRIEHCKSLTNEQAELEENFVSSHVEKNNRIPTFIDAIEYGMEYCKQQMMAKAVDVTIAIPYQNGYGGYTQLLDSKEGLPFGDKLKVLVIKEE